MCKFRSWEKHKWKTNSEALNLPLYAPICPSPRGLGHIGAYMYNNVGLLD